MLVQGAGDDNEVCGNHIYAGLIGISCSRVRNVNVHHNTIHNMSSIGILTVEGVVDGQFHDNLVYDCNINLRIHHYNTPRDNQRREFHYRNRFYEPEGIGESIYVHWLNDRWPPQTEHPQIWLYHNSFAGGRCAMSPSGWSVKGGGLQRTRMLNNIFASPMFFYASETFIGTRTMIELCDFNWVGGKLHHGKPAWFGEHNAVAEDKQMWPPGKLPDFTLTADSPARGKGMDLSKPFTLGGKTYDPLPGMKPGYFRGPAPDCGALQFGETVKQK
ncbi:MAG: right-handed parallel beta-helix repeat-containing protein [Verrucomicrobia bacterium]|nr:right-handed parallel beta-helix repeat-containing protein [Verrucomicrobiota bacterium]